mmetsp:Transcript_5755/g.16674  ORF Transcript_5755/g.16674 Transcript_5755/m.16674 type:complete len:458 (+) Transcript_5755:173-1546(+)
MKQQRKNKTQTARAAVIAYFSTRAMLSPWSVEGFVLPQHSSLVSTALQSTATRSTSSSPYGTVDSAGPTWTGQRWEGQKPTFEQQFAQKKMEQGTLFPGIAEPYQDQPNIRERESAPLARPRRSSYSERLAEPPPPQDDGMFFARPGPREPMPPPQREERRREERPPAYFQDPRADPRANPAFASPNPPPMRMPEHAQEINGGARGTWSSMYDNEHDEVQVTIASNDGRPIKADIDVYQGPDNTPQKMRVYSEDGRRRPFTTLIQTPQGASKTQSMVSWYQNRNLFRSPNSMATGGSHSISVKNIGPMEFPIIAGVEGRGTVSDEERAASMTDYSGRSMSSFLGRKQTIHGGHLRTFPLDINVASVEVRITSEGLPVMAIVELWQGPGEVKTVAQVYCDDGQGKPFKAIIETPGSVTNTIAIRNMGPTAYPIDATVEIYAVDNTAYSYGEYYPPGGY